jgi:hypothetical protein
MASRRTLVRLLGVRLTGLVRGFRQTSLFDAEQDFKTESRSAIVSAMDDIRDKYGASVVQSGEAAWLSNSR